MSISASIVQGSSLGPASYAVASWAVTAADLKPLHADNKFVKFADGTYLIVPHSRRRTGPHSGVGDCEQLTLNTTKTKEVIFHDSRRRHSVQSLPLLPGVARDFTLKVLGVTLSSHCQCLTTSATSSVTERSRCMPCASYGITV